MKSLFTSALFFLLSTAMAQDFCFTDSFKKFQYEDKLECKNLVIANLSFMNDGKNVFLVGQTGILDTLARYFATKKFIYEIDYETKDPKVSEQAKSKLEESVRNYLISKNSVNQVKVFKEAHDKIDHSLWIPQHMNAAFFFVLIYPSK